MSYQRLNYKGKNVIRIMAAVLAALLLAVILPVADPVVSADSDGMIRVKLTRLGSAVSSITMTTVGGYSVNGKSIPSGSTVKVSLSDGSLKLTAGGNQLVSGSSITMSRTSGGTGTGVRFTSPSLSNLFCGDLRFTVSGSSIQTVISIYIETYLYGVVPYEMSNSFPIEALKAQAISARTYAMRAKRTSGSYDVTDNTSSQVFKGYNSSYKNAIQAVDGTKGVVLMAGSSYAQCYYTSSNGGQTESTKNAWGSSVSYLTVKDDPYDKENPNSIVKSYSIPKNPKKKALNAQFEAALIAAAAEQLADKGLSGKADDVEIEQIVAVEPHTPKYDTPSRTFTKLSVTVKLTSESLSTGNEVSTKVEVELDTYAQLQSMLTLSINSADNEIVSVEETDDAFVLSFARYGHGIGLSQRGAQWMAKQYGKDYEEILSFYYPGTKQTRLSLNEIILGGEYEPDPTPTRAPVESDDGYITLQEGDSGEAVKKLQTRLKELGYFTGTPLGNYKTLTVSAVMAYQKAMGLEADGIATPKLQKMIFAEQKPTATLAPTQTPEQQPSDNEKYASVSLGNTSSKLNVRKRADAKSEIVGTLRHGTKVEVLSVSGDWRQIKADALTGYVKAEYLEFIGPEQTEAPDTEKGYTTLQYGDSGEAVRLLQEQLHKLGYFNGATLGNYKSQTTAAVKSYQEDMGLTADGIATPELQEMIFAGKLPEATAKPETTSGPDAEVQKAIVSLGKNSSRLNLRSQASTASSVITALKNGTEVIVLSTENGWSRVQTDGLVGYVKSSYLVDATGEHPTDSPSETPGPDDTSESGVATIKLRSASSKLNVRKSATTNSAIVGTLKHGTRVEVLESSDGWSRIRSGSMTGYVMTSYLSQSVPAEPTPEPTKKPEESGEYKTLSYGDSGEAVKRLQIRLKELGYFDGQLGGNYLKITRAAVEAYQQANGWTVNGIASPELQKEIFEEANTVSTNATVRVGSGSYLNLREKAGSGSDVVMKMQNGMRVCVTGTEGEWYKILTTNGQKGYAKKDYIRMDD
ncbi:MAG: SpoIID/LytB domain-containing protein [Clostridia bacterium]|nr:SpoIID/LytB domain-containing protein [Clostridia bacterium]